MNTDWFDKIVVARLNDTEDRLRSKAKEYASNVDRLENFKLSAEEQRCTPSQALRGMVSKHWVAVGMAIKSGELLPKKFWDEKLGDIIAYMILLEAIETERRLDGIKRPRGVRAKTTQITEHEEVPASKAAGPRKLASTEAVLNGWDDITGRWLKSRPDTKIFEGHDADNPIYNLEKILDEAVEAKIRADRRR